MTLLMIFEDKIVDYQNLNWDEIIDTMKFYRHYSKVPLHVYVYENKVCKVQAKIKSALHYNTFIMMCEEQFSKE